MLKIPCPASAFRVRRKGLQNLDAAVRIRSPPPSNNLTHTDAPQASALSRRAVSPNSRTDTPDNSRRATRALRCRGKEYFKSVRQIPREQAVKEDCAIHLRLAVQAAPRNVLIGSRNAFNLITWVGAGYTVWLGLRTFNCAAFWELTGKRRPLSSTPGRSLASPFGSFSSVHHPIAAFLFAAAINSIIVD